MEFFDYLSKCNQYESVMDDNGYHILFVGDHPHNNRGYMLVHRLVMESHLQRYLNTDEVIHHINEIKTDNRLENLYLCSQEEHIQIHNRGAKKSLEKRSKIRKGVVEANRRKNQKIERD